MGTSRITEPQKIALACVLGNFLEFFDFALYGFFVIPIGGAFFPLNTTASALLSALAVFGVAFLVRPIGGVVFGVLGDRVGRKAALSASIVVMGSATTAIGLLPTYAQVGVLAPTLLVILRSVQGLAHGGEWGAASAYLIESAGPGRRGIMGSLTSMSAAFGLIFGSLIALGLGLLLSPKAMQVWGWRLPFMLAAPLCLFGIYIRRRLQDSPVFHSLEASRERVKPKWRDAFSRDQRLAFLVTFSFSWICGVGLFFLGSYIINYLIVTARMPRDVALLSALVALAFYSILCVVMGRISDVVGRRPMLLASCAGYVILAVPLFVAFASGQLLFVVPALFLYAVIQAALNTNTTLVLVELFPASTRMTNASLAFNLGVGAPSGFAPFIAAWLVTATRLNFAPGFFLSGVGLFSFIVLFLHLPETKGRNLLLEHDATKDAHLGQPSDDGNTTNLRAISR